MDYQVRDLEAEATAAAAAQAAEANGDLPDSSSPASGGAAAAAEGEQLQQNAKDVFNARKADFAFMIIECPVDYYSDPKIGKTLDKLCARFAALNS